eukprot:TRINITY_DN12704_c0_g1_i3.p2 TRINITY_DN12704_c0_g1~~TRINITY_DN12704_c0_g1_i3.p2  ORF type:complete len:589 (+),score=144.42 TRINITY_DN12704_c0_g1_i3:105-1769(+)
MSHGRAPCRHWARGNCTFGDSCGFAHGGALPRTQARGSDGSRGGTARLAPGKVVRVFYPEGSGHPNPPHRLQQTGNYYYPSEDVLVTGGMKHGTGQICPRWLTGTCSAGTSCTAAHVSPGARVLAWKPAPECKRLPTIAYSAELLGRPAGAKPKILSHGTEEAPEQGGGERGQPRTGEQSYREQLSPPRGPPPTTVQRSSHRQGPSDKGQQYGEHGSYQQHGSHQQRGGHQQYGGYQQHGSHQQGGDYKQYIDYRGPVFQQVTMMQPTLLIRVQHSHARDSPAAPRSSHPPPSTLTLNPDAPPYGAYQATGSRSTPRPPQSQQWSSGAGGLEALMYLRDINMSPPNMSPPRHQPARAQAPFMPPLGPTQPPWGASGLFEASSYAPPAPTVHWGPAAHQTSSGAPRTAGGARVITPPRPAVHSPAPSQASRISETGAAWVETLLDEVQSPSPRPPRAAQPLPRGVGSSGPPTLAGSRSASDSGPQRSGGSGSAPREASGSGSGSGSSWQHTVPASTYTTPSQWTPGDSTISPPRPCGQGFAASRPLFGPLAPRHA